jgi:hypothetical protein
MKYVKGFIHGWIVMFAIAGIVYSAQEVAKESAR